MTIQVIIQQKILMYMSIIGATIVALLVATLTFVPAAFAQSMPPGNEQHSMPRMDSTQKVGLPQEIANFRSRIAQIQTTIDRNHQGGSFEAATQPVDMAMDDGMGGSDAASKPAMNNKPMPTAADSCSRMMDKMGAPAAAPGSAPTTMTSALPGFPGVSHLYHVGATSFFLDYSVAIDLAVDQQAALNGIKEKSLGDLAAAQRQIDQVEQELWMLTGSDQPDSMALETKVREIERLKGDQRVAFIRSVGEAARLLSDDQRTALLGTDAVERAQMTAPEGSAGSMEPQGGMGDDAMGNMGGAPPPHTQDDGGSGDM